MLHRDHGRVKSKLFILGVGHKNQLIILTDRLREIMSTQQPVCLGDFDGIARRRLAKNAFDYYQSGANDEQSLRDNVDAFQR